MKKPLFAAILLALAAPRARALRVETMPLPANYRAAAAIASGAPTPSMLVVSGQAIVRFSTSAPDQAAQNAALQAVGARVTSELPFGWTLVGLPAGISVSSGLALLNNIKNISETQPDHAYLLKQVYPNDPLAYPSSAPEYPALSSINAFAGWGYGTGSSATVTIAMIDSGIDSIHEDLSAKVISGANQFFDPDNSGTQSADNPPAQACYHGTATAGVAAASANNSKGIAGISWGAKLVSLRVFNAADCNSDCSNTDANCGVGQLCGCATDDAAMSKALNYAISTLAAAPSTYGRIVVNMSIGGAYPCSTDPLTNTALSDAVTAGIPVTISAGNNGSSVEAPANCAGTSFNNGIIPVGATNQNNTAVATSADWGTGHGSSNGPELAANGVVAPGTNIETTILGNSYSGNNDGTSFAAPAVAGLAALLLSAQPNATVADIHSWIRNGATSLGESSDMQGTGIINVYNSMRLASGASISSTPGPYSFPNPFRIATSGLVSFSIPPSLAGSNTTIRIYTITGQLVRELTGELNWDGRNTSGNLVASGTYFFEVKSSAGHAVGRMAVIR